MGEATSGLTDKPVEALRYNSTNFDPHESTYAICSFIENGKSILDVGCGTGSITAMIAKATNGNVVGIEPNHERAEAARLLGLDVTTGYFDTNFISSHEPYDYIIFADVLEHTPDPYQILIDARRALKRDGLIITSIPNVAHWTVRLSLLFGKFDYQPTGIMDATHLRWFTRTTIRRLFESAGYRVVGVKFSAGAWMPEYQRSPFAWLPQAFKDKILWWMVSRFPGIFACQFIVCATQRPADF